VGRIYEACQDTGYILVITADHGNAEQMINLETGAPHTAHTTNAVPFIVTGGIQILHDEKGADGEETEEGALCDVAPSILDIMGLDKPEGECGLLVHIFSTPECDGLKDMTGRSLIKR
jgi:2,3-bisphosphoglycerate-independent phosphoglycerate mutase